MNASIKTLTVLLTILAIYLLTACATSTENTIESCSDKVKRLKPESTSTQRYVFCELLDDQERNAVDKNWNADSE